MKKLPRLFVAALLAVCISLPSPVLALRPQSDLAGLEEKFSARPVQPFPENLPYELVPLTAVPEFYNSLGTLDRFEFDERLLREKGTDRYYFAKWRTPSDELAWPVRNDPAREYLFSQLVRVLGGNVADVVIPPADQRRVLSEFYEVPNEEDFYLVRLSMSYSADRSEDREAVQEMDPSLVFTRNFGIAVLLRMYDFKEENLGSIEGSNALMIFDGEQAFHPNLGSIKRFIPHFVLNYWLYLYDETSDDPLQIDPNELLEKLYLKELKRLVEKVEGLDRSVVKRIIQEAPDHLKGSVRVAAAPLLGPRSWMNSYRKDLAQFLLYFARPEAKIWRSNDISLISREPLAITAKQVLRTFDVAPTGLEEQVRLARELLESTRRLIHWNPDGEIPSAQDTANRRRLADRTYQLQLQLLQQEGLLQQVVYPKSGLDMRAMAASDRILTIDPDRAVSRKMERPVGAFEHFQTGHANSPIPLTKDELFDRVTHVGRVYEESKTEIADFLRAAGKEPATLLLKGFLDWGPEVEAPFQWVDSTLRPGDRLVLFGDKGLRAEFQRAGYREYFSTSPIQTVLKEVDQLLVSEIGARTPIYPPWAYEEQDLDQKAVPSQTTIHLAEPFTVLVKPAIEVIHPERVQAADLRGILWDFDDTLWLTGTPLRAEAEELARLLDRDPSDSGEVDRLLDFMRRTVGFGWDERMAALRKEGWVVPDDWKQGISRVTAAFHEGIRGEERDDPRFLVSAARGSFLKRSGKPNFIRRSSREVPPRPEAITRKNLGSANSLVKTESTGVDIRPSSMQNAAQRWKLQLEDMAFISDGVEDIKVAKRQGALAIGFAATPEARLKLIEAGADGVINRDYAHLDEILSALRINNPAGLEEDENASGFDRILHSDRGENLKLKSAFEMLRQWRQQPGTVSPAALSEQLASVLERSDPEFFYWRRALQYRLEQAEVLFSQNPDQELKVPFSGEYLAKKIYNLLFLPFKKEEVVSSLKALDRRPADSFWEPVVRVREFDPSLDASEVGRFLNEASEVQLFGSMMEGHPSPHADLDLRFQFLDSSLGYGDGRRWYALGIPLSLDGFFDIQVLDQRRQKHLLMAPSLSMSPSSIFRMQDGKIFFRGERFAQIFLQNQEIRDGLRSGISPDHPLPEWKIARQALEIQRSQLNQTAGLEDRVERVARVTEEAAEGGRVAVVSSAALEAMPVLQAAMERLAGLEERMILYGDSPAVRELLIDRPGILHARNAAELSGVFGRLIARGSVERVTYLGGLEEGRIVGVVAGEWGLASRVVPPALLELFAAFVPEPLARELAAGLEETELIGGQA